jgi:PHP family Zn ribbon phosphoesterase
MRIAVDLHIHSALSPCGHQDMTPNNIINMAHLKGLDAIGLTDHNSAENIQAVMDLGQKKGIIVVPGMEVQSREEVHMLCYFPSVEITLDFQEFVYSNLEGVNNPDFFGHQYVMDADDSIVRENDRLLIGSTGLSVERICTEVVNRGGKAVPAHVDRRSYSIISNLGFIPPGLPIDTIEVNGSKDIEQLLNEFPFLKGYRIIRSSDAHRLQDILEREWFIDVSQKCLGSIIEYL